MKKNNENYFPESKAMSSNNLTKAPIPKNQYKNSKFSLYQKQESAYV